MDSVPTPLKDPTAPSPPPELRPYAPSWLDHLIRGVERLPFPNGLVYLAVFIAGHVVIAIVRTEGSLTLGQTLSSRRESSGSG